MQLTTSHEKKIIILTTSLIIWVFAISLITPTFSKKPDTKINNSNNMNNSSNAGIEIYWDKQGTNRVTSLEWGSLEPGTEKTITLFIKNKGKNSITLSYFISNWQTPEIVNYLNLTWDYIGQPIQFKELFQLKFTLYIAENAKTTENFSFDITIISN